MGRNNGTRRPKVDRRSKNHKRTKGQTSSPAERGTRDGTPKSFEKRIDEIPGLELKELSAFIEEGRAPENVRLQYKLLTSCLLLILMQMSGATGNKRNPKPEQVYTLRRLIYGDGDTLLIAATGWGKSVIFHAYTVLTGKITLQIIPLKKLGGEQLADIRKLGCTEPCLLTSDSKKEQKNLIAKIKAGEYTHVLFGPEQASSKEFREALKDNEFQSKLGLVAIDECHLVDQWKDFRAQFTMLGELRTILHRRVVWFGCSATLEEDAERLVLKSAGFRPEGKHRYQTEVVRTSINRNDIRLSILPIPRGGLTNYSTLYFLLDKATSVDENGQILVYPNEIPKTVIFLDSKAECEILAQFLRKLLVAKTSKNMPCCQYSTKCENPTYDVFNVVQTFHADVQKWDQDMRYNEFLKLDSLIRIMVATTSLGMGMNFPDIEIVVNWKFPIGDSVSEAWQRAGRGGRAKDMVSKAYFFFPYWAFDSEGRDNTDKSLPALVVPAQKPKKPKKRVKNTLPSKSRDRKTKIHTSSRVQSSTNASNLSENISASGMSQGEDEEEVSSSSVEAVLDTQSISAAGDADEDTRPFWSQRDQARRATLAPCWKELCNAPCKRRPILERLGEGKLLAGTKAVESHPSVCCNGCNPELAPIITELPETPQTLKEPKVGTKAGFALALLNKWAVKHAEVIYNHPNRRFPLPSTVIIPRELAWRLAHLYTGGVGAKKPIFWNTLDLNSLLQEVPSLERWRHLEGLKADLLQKLKDMLDEVDNEMEEKRQASATNDQEKASTVAEQSISNTPGVRGGSLFQNVADDDLRKRTIIQNQIRNQSLCIVPVSSQTTESSILSSPPVVQATRHISTGPETPSYRHALFRGFLAENEARTLQIVEDALAKARSVDAFLSSPNRGVDPVNSQELISETRLPDTVEALLSLTVVPKTQLGESGDGKPRSQSVLPETKLRDVIIHSNLEYSTPSRCKRPVYPPLNTPSKRKKLRDCRANFGGTLFSNDVTITPRNRAHAPPTSPTSISLQRSFKISN